MARPSEPEKRRELGRKAVDVLRLLGLEISMTRLAAELGVKRPTLLYHFPTRGHIVLAALEELLVDQTRFVLARIAEHAHPIDRLYARITAVHAYHHGNEARLVFLSQAIAAVGQERFAEVVAVGNRVFEVHRRAQAEQLQRGIEQGIVHPCDVDALMALVRSVTDGLVVHRLMTGLALAPVHRFFWDRVLLPLKRDPEQTDPGDKS